MNLTIIKFRKIKTKTEQIESLFGLGFSKVSLTELQLEDITFVIERFGFIE